MPWYLALEIYAFWSSWWMHNYIIWTWFKAVKKSGNQCTERANTVPRRLTLTCCMMKTRSRTWRFNVREIATRMAMSSWYLVPEMGTSVSTEPYSLNYELWPCTTRVLLAIILSQRKTQWPWNPRKVIYLKYYTTLVKVFASCMYTWFINVSKDKIDNCYCSAAIS